MKWFLILIILFLTSCTPNLEDEKIIYENFINELKSTPINQVNEDMPFTINVYFEQIIDNEIVYRVIIDEPKMVIKNIKAIAIHNYKTNNIYPTVGIFEEPLHLDPNYINLEDNYVGGVVLVGYIPFIGSINDFSDAVKVLVEYQDQNNIIHKVVSVHYN
jgi:hypothetical protein